MKHKKKLIVAIILAGVLLLAIYLAARPKDKTEYSTAKAEIGNIVQTVSETGTVKSREELELSFLTSGQVKELKVVVGQKVKAGEVLALLDSESLQIKEREAQASVAVARANYNKLVSGATAEERSVSEANAKQAKTAYEASIKEQDRSREIQEENVRQAQKALDDLEDPGSGTLTTYEQAVISAKTALDNAKSSYQKAIDDNKESYLSILDDKQAVANTALDQISTIIEEDDLEDNFSIKDPTYKSSAINSYNSGASLLEQAKIVFSAAKANNSDENALRAIEATLGALDRIFLSLDSLYKALENTISGGDLSASELEAFKSTVSGQITLVGAAVSAVQTAKQNLDSAVLNYRTNVASAQNSLVSAEAAYNNAVLAAKNALASAKLNRDRENISMQSRVDNAFEAWQVAQRQFEKVVAGPNRHDISLAQAQLAQAESALNAVNRQISDSILKAPIDGLVTRIEFEPGEQAVSGRSAVSMLGEEEFEIEVLISEADIAKVSVGDPAEVTLDAFGDEIKFLASVRFVEPAETVIQDVIYYKLKIDFAHQESQLSPEFFSRIKSGMTANVVLTTAYRENVLIIPNRAVIDRNGEGKIVRVLVGGQLREKKVTLGLKGDNGLVEIVSGLEVDDIVVTRIVE